MSSEKRWLKQVIKEAADKHYEMPWKHNVRPAAFTDLHQEKDQAKAA
jgi:hypothetical protein